MNRVGSRAAPQGSTGVSLGSASGVCLAWGNIKMSQDKTDKTEYKTLSSGVMGNGVFIW